MLFWDGIFWGSLNYHFVITVIDICRKPKKGYKPVLNKIFVNLVKTLSNHKRCFHKTLSENDFRSMWPGMEIRLHVTWSDYHYSLYTLTISVLNAARPLLNALPQCGPYLRRLSNRRLDLARACPDHLTVDRDHLLGDLGKPAPIPIVY